MAIELELPAFYVDAAVLDPTPTRPAIVNRDPEPGERQVPVGASISFDITEVGTDVIDTSNTQVYVGGVLAFANGNPMPGFTAQVSNPQPDTLHLKLCPAAPFSSLQTVAVRVTTQTKGGASKLDLSWSFQCQDLTAPNVVGAQARELGRVRVGFDEPVVQTSALTPSNYTLERLSIPAVDARVTSIEPVSDSSVDIITDIELSPGGMYRLSVGPVADLFGNTISAPTNAVVFHGFVPPRHADRRFDLYSFFPEMNRREDDTGDLKRFIACLQEITDLLLNDIDRFTEILDPDIAAESFLDLMLQELANPFPFDLSVIDKRRLLNVLLAIYREKGTAPGLTNAIRFFLGLEVEITAYSGEGLVLGQSILCDDWVLGPSKRWSLYAFDVIAPRALTVEERERTDALVAYMKPAHTHFRLVEPAIPEIIDHLELGLSELGNNWILH